MKHISAFVFIMSLILIFSLYTVSGQEPEDPLPFEASYYPTSNEFDGDYYSVRIKNSWDEEIVVDDLRFEIQGEGYGTTGLQHWGDGVIKPGETKRFKIPLSMGSTPGSDPCGDEFTWTLSNIYTEEVYSTNTGNLRCQVLAEEGSNLFDVEYSLGFYEDNQNYVLYLLPFYEGVDHSEIYITAGFESPNNVRIRSNHPDNAYPEELRYDSLLEMYEIVGVEEDRLYNYYDVINIRLFYSSDTKEWIIPLDYVKIDKIEKIIPKEDEPIDLEDIITDSADSEEKTIYLCWGCLLDEKCYPYGFRKEGQYCSDTNDEFVIQQESDTLCENNFECNSNLCVDNQCLSSSLWQKFLRWLKSIFG